MCGMSMLAMRERMSLKNFNGNSLLRLAILGSAMLLLAACQDENGGLSNARAYRPIPPETLSLMEQKGTSKAAPMLIRSFKKEAEFEIWKMKADGRYALLKTFPMCRWSGQLGPKTREGDRQVPEGFYNITPAQMNPNSNYYLSFNVGYPNALDKSLGRQGGLIMVHGACSSAGCFSMTDNQIAEIYSILRESFAGGQKTIQMESLPFRMSADNLAKHRLDPNINFWKQLKQGSDNFEVTKLEPKVGVCNRHYVFNAQSANASQQLDANAICPPLKEDEDIRREVAAKQAKDEVAVAELVAKGVKPVRVLYADGGQHPDFAALTANVSRPEALAAGPVEVALGETAVKKSPAVQMAAAKTDALALASAKPVEQSAVGKLPAKAQPVTPDAVSAFAAGAPTEAAATDGSQPFFKRWLGSAPVEPVTTSAAPVETHEPDAPVPANVPLPPRRQAAKQATVKPQASPQKISGASPLLAPGFAGAYGNAD